jgi:hypothetical protein
MIFPNCFVELLPCTVKKNIRACRSLQAIWTRFFRPFTDKEENPLDSFTLCSPVNVNIGIKDPLLGLF